MRCGAESQNPGSAKLEQRADRAINLEQVLHTVIRNIDELFNREAVILLPEDGRLVVRASSLVFR